jgi:hypothetical protein
MKTVHYNRYAVEKPLSKGVMPTFGVFSKFAKMAALDAWQEGHEVTYFCYRTGVWSKQGIWSVPYVIVCEIMRKKIIIFLVEINEVHINL